MSQNMPRPEVRKNSGGPFGHYAFLMEAGLALVVMLIVLYGSASVWPKQATVYHMVFVVPLIYVVTAVLMARRTDTLSGLRVLPKEFKAGDFARVTLSILALWIAAIAALIWFQPEVLSNPTALLRGLFDLSDKFTLPGLRSLVGSPFSEELLFRGWLLTYVARELPGGFRLWKLRLTRANLLSALAFGLVHLMNGFSPGFVVRVAVAIIAGLILGHFREKSGSLLVPMWGHFVGNFLG